MKRHVLVLSSLLPLLSTLACRDKEPVSAFTRITGTYHMYRLTQYRDGKQVFNGYLPYLAVDSIRITKQVSVDQLAKGMDRRAFVNLSEREETVRPQGGTNSKSTGGPIGGLNILTKLSVDGNDFYRDGTRKIGHGDGTVLFFDTEEKDSLGHTIRYVFEAKKVSDIPNRDIPYRF